MQNLTQPQELDLGNDQIGDAVAAKLDEALQNRTQLTVLNLGNNRIGDTGAEKLA